ncbi:MAG: iron ABC transporter permease [Candidatus Gastranaerophilales bacterium]|nr:iron ABC transporter permease [Candidatus Gastranaerophilales bacterium]
MRKYKNICLLILCITIFLGCLYLDLFQGYVKISLNDLRDFIVHNDTSNTQILGLIRFPKILKAIIAGVSLATAGLFMQVLSKNPLVEPYITGVSSGAGLALVGAILLNISPSFYSISAFLGAIAIASIVIGFAGYKKFSITKLILIGLSINIFAGSIISAMILLNPSKAYSLLVILSGNLNNSLAGINTLVFIFTITMLLSVFMVPKLNFLKLDFSIVNALTKNPHKYFIFLVILSSILAAASVCAAGIIGFVGIIIPHLSRIIIGYDLRWVFVISSLLGASIILISDFLARTILFPTELPIGLVIAMIGAPIFLILLILSRKKIYA